MVNIRRNALLAIAGTHLFPCESSSFSPPRVEEEGSP
jgi:hypothetical protein